MNFSFYTELMKQEDIKDLGIQLNDPFDTLHTLNQNIHNLSDQDKVSASFAEITVKVENLINKHLPNLIYDYCKLSFDYRNTKVIKEEKLNNQLHKFTAKHIFLSNLTKLIEEIYVLENQFNDNYIHKLLVQKRLVDQLGIQKNIVQVEYEMEYVKPVNLINNFNYLKYKEQVKPVVKPVFNINHEVVDIDNVKIEQPQINDKNNTITTININQLIKPPIVVDSLVTKEKYIPENKEDPLVFNIKKAGCELLLGMLLIGGGVATVFNMFNQPTMTEFATTDSMSAINSSIKKIYAKDSIKDYSDITMEKLNKAGMKYEDFTGQPIKFSDNAPIEYKNYYNGIFSVKPHTILNKNDSYEINTTNLPSKVCVFTANKIGKRSEQLLINNVVIKENKNTVIDKTQIEKNCSGKSNNVTIINS